jgi:hypothetical protein
MNKQTICTEIRSSRFDFDTPTKTFVTEMSALERMDPLRQIWNDSCDAGFVLISSQTGARLVMVLVEEPRLPGVETIRWVFTAVSNDPGLQKLRATIWNT